MLLQHGSGTFVASKDCGSFNVRLRSTYSCAVDTGTHSQSIDCDSDYSESRAANCHCLWRHIGI